MEPAEFILKIVIILSLCFGILGIIVQSSQFEGVVLAQDAERLSVDLAHASAGMPCLTDSVGGESRDGVLLESALDKYDGTNACMSLDVPWSVTVTDGTKTWTMGQPITAVTYFSKTLPVAIKRADGTVVPGTLTTKTELVGK
jgi:hypothetical protein